MKDDSKGNKMQIRIDIETETGIAVNINDSLGFLVACCEVVGIQWFWERFDSHPRLP